MLVDHLNEEIDLEEPEDHKVSTSTPSTGTHESESEANHTEDIAEAQKEEAVIEAVNETPEEKTEEEDDDDDQVNVDDGEEGSTGIDNKIKSSEDNFQNARITISKLKAMNKIVHFAS